MTLVLNGTTGVSAVDGSAATPAIQGNDTNTGVFFPAADTVAIATGGTERVRTDASGNVGIGTSSPGYKLTVSGRISYSGAIGEGADTTLSSSGVTLILGESATWTALSLRTSGSERARIDSSGNLLVGTTSPLSNVSGFQVSYNPGASKYAGAVVNTKTDNSTVTNGLLVKYTGVSPSDGNYIFLCQDAGNTNRFFVTNAGGTGGTSDAALKKNIETTRDGYVNDLCKIRIVKYNWNTQDDNAPKYLGWIAQEVEEVFPRMVETDPETGFKSVTYSPFVPMLIKAIQEQQALIAALQADVAALKGQA